MKARVCHYAVDDVGRCPIDGETLTLVEALHSGPCTNRKNGRCQGHDIELVLTPSRPASPDVRAPESRRRRSTPDAR